MQLKIDPEFQSLIPPLTPEEFRQLETNIIEDGCRDPLQPEIGGLMTCRTS